MSVVGVFSAELDATDPRTTDDDDLLRLDDDDLLRLDLDDDSASEP